MWTLHRVNEKLAARQRTEMWTTFCDILWSFITLCAVYFFSNVGHIEKMGAIRNQQRDSGQIPFSDRFQPRALLEFQQLGESVFRAGADKGTWVGHRVPWFSSFGGKTVFPLPLATNHYNDAFNPYLLFINHPLLDTPVKFLWGMKTYMRLKYQELRESFH